MIIEWSLDFLSKQELDKEFGRYHRHENMRDDIGIGCSGHILLILIYL